jgi:hypothetical protein
VEVASSSTAAPTHYYAAIGNKRGRRLSLFFPAGKRSPMSTNRGRPLQNEGGFGSSDRPGSGIRCRCLLRRLNFEASSGLNYGSYEAIDKNYYW